jgi:cytochrome c
MALKVLVPAFVAAVLFSGVAVADGDAEKGKQVFSKCGICHATVPGENKVGPSLAGIVGRKSASDPKFAYSDAMKKYDQVWDAKTLDAYLVNPRQSVPGTKMIFVGLRDANDRANVIAYLATLN